MGKRYDDEVSTNGIRRRHVASCQHDQRFIKWLCACVPPSIVNSGRSYAKASSKRGRLISNCGSGELLMYTDVKDFIPTAEPPSTVTYPNLTVSEVGGGRSGREQFYYFAIRRGRIGCDECNNGLSAQPSSTLAASIKVCEQMSNAPDKCLSMMRLETSAILLYIQTSNWKHFW